MIRYLMLTILLASTSVFAGDPSFICTITVNDTKAIKVQPQMQDTRTGFFEYMDGMYDDNHIKISYYPGIETVVLKVYDQVTDKTYLKNPSPASAGNYNLIVEEKDGIFGNPNLKNIKLNCDLNL